MILWIPLPLLWGVQIPLRRYGLKHGFSESLTKMLKNIAEGFHWIFGSAPASLSLSLPSFDALSA